MEQPSTQRIIKNSVRANYSQKKSGPRDDGTDTEAAEAEAEAEREVGRTESEKETRKHSNIFWIKTRLASFQSLSLSLSTVIMKRFKIGLREFVPGPEQIRMRKHAAYSSHFS